MKKNKTKKKNKKKQKKTECDVLQFCLALTMLWANSSDDKFMIFFIFFLENRIRHIMQIVIMQKETICMMCQILFSIKYKKNISTCRLLIFLPSMQSVKNFGIPGEQVFSSRYRIKNTQVVW